VRGGALRLFSAVEAALVVVEARNEVGDRVDDVMRTRLAQAAACLVVRRRR
jgi:hypothetical protein